MKNTLRATHQDFFEIAKKIDNEFIGKDGSFRQERKIGYHLLFTPTCDNCPMIRIHTDKNFDITSIEINGEYTEGWQSVTTETLNKIIH